MDLLSKYTRVSFQSNVPWRDRTHSKSSKRNQVYSLTTATELQINYIKLYRTTINYSLFPVYVHTYHRWVKNRRWIKRWEGKKFRRGILSNPHYGKEIAEGVKSLKCMSKGQRVKEKGRGILQSSSRSIHVARECDTSHTCTLWYGY